MPSVVIELISADMVESYRREAASSPSEWRVGCGKRLERIEG